MVSFYCNLCVDVFKFLFLDVINLPLEQPQSGFRFLKPSKICLKIQLRKKSHNLHN